MPIFSLRPALRRFAHALRAARLTGALAATAALAAVTACGSSADPAGPTAAQISLSDTVVSVRVGDDAAVTARTRDAAGKDLVGRPIFWSSRDTTVATVTQAGVIRGMRPGTTQISASSEGQSAVATVSVAARPVVALTADPAVSQLVVGATQRLAARATNDAGTAVAAAVTWTSLTPAVVAVTPDGVVTGLAPGVGSVRATAEGVTADAVFVVAPVPAASVRVTPATASIVVGATQQLAATASDAAGNALAGRVTSWTSRDPAVAAVSSTGQVTGLAPGTATIAATVEGQTATATVTVRPTPVAAVTVSPASSSVGVGGTVRLGATTADAAGNPLAGRTVTWSSSAPAVARVDATGLVTGVAPGTATLTATSEGVAGTATVRVVATSPASVAFVEVTPATATLTQGDTRAFTATPRASDGTAIIGRTVVWTSTTSAVANVTSAGVVTAASPGTTTITANVDGITGAAAVTVQRPPVAAIAITPATSTFKAGTRQQLTATLSDAAGRTLAGRVVTWTVLNTAVATVTDSGLVTGVGPGTATVAATSEGVTATSTVNVSAVVIVSPTTVTVTERGSGRSAQLFATDHTGRVLTAAEVTWSSSNPAVATVDASGRVSGVSAQGGSATATITATYRGATGASTVTVVPK